MGPFYSAEEMFEAIEARHRARPWWEKLERQFWRVWRSRPRPISTARFYRQRMQKGYGFRDLWSFDNYLAETIARGLRELAEIKSGTPTAFYPGPIEELSKPASQVPDYDAKWEQAEADWYRWLIETAELFEDYARDDFVYDPDHGEKVKAMFARLAEHFGSLWD